jgi:RNA polymerase sigma-70 factor (ECF subfamily)
MIADTQQDLVSRAQSGDDSAFQELVTSWQRRIVGMVARLTGAYDEAEDIAQEVFVRVYFSLGTLREPGQFEPWLYRIAKNAAMDYLRRRRRLRFSDLSEEQVFAAERAEAMRDSVAERDRERMRELAHELLDLLGPEDRSLLVMKEIEGLSVKQLCDVFGASENTIKVRLFRARKRVLGRWSHSPATKARPYAPVVCVA